MMTRVAKALSSQWIVYFTAILAGDVFQNHKKRDIDGKEPNLYEQI